MKRKQRKNLFLLIVLIFLVIVVSIIWILFYSSSENKLLDNLTQDNVEIVKEDGITYLIPVNGEDEEDNELFETAKEVVSEREIHDSVVYTKSMKINSDLSAYTFYQLDQEKLADENADDIKKVESLIRKESDGEFLNLESIVKDGRMGDLKRSVIKGVLEDKQADKEEFIDIVKGSLDGIYLVESSNEEKTDNWKVDIPMTSNNGEKYGTFLNVEDIGSLIVDEVYDKKEIENESKSISLTFDDGPDPEWTEKILDVLKEENVKATFYLLGERAAEYPEITKRIVDEGHEVGSHFMTHKSLVTLKDDEVENEFYDSMFNIYHATGEVPTSVRPPYGAINKKIADIIDYPIVEWSVDTNDWSARAPGQIVDTVKQYSSDGSIVLLHSIHETSYKSVRDIIKFLKSNNYNMITVEEMFGEDLRNKYQYFDEYDSRKF